MIQKYVNLHTHSYYSILESVLSPQDILDKAEKLGHPKVALTDKGNGYGLVEFYEKSKKAGTVKPILGVEIFLTKDSRFEKRIGIDGREKYLVLLAKNQKGYENLLKIISAGNLEGLFQEKARIDYETLEQHAEGLICLTGDFNGYLADSFLNLGETKAEENLQKLITIFGKENFYLELCARGNFPEQQKINEWKVQLSQKLNLNLVATTNARFNEKEDEEAADTLYSIGKSHQEFNQQKFVSGNWFKSWNEITDELHYLEPEILEIARKNTLKIAEKIQFELEFGNDLLPNFEVPEGETEATQLLKNCEKEIPNRYPTKEEKIEAKERLTFELSIISKMGFDAYFLIVADFIDFAKDNGIAVGPGRGSAAGSIVAYLLGITNIDPLKYELLFERFLNPARISMPDIDIDFSDERRDEVLQYVIEKYGSDKVSKVCTFGTLAAKAALKDVGRARGIDFAKMNAMTKILPNKPGFSLDDAKEMKEFQEFLKKNPELKKIFELAHKLEGCVRHVSVHACAVIIGGSDLRENTPIQWAPGAEEIKITQYPYQQLEHLGLLKMDFLGLRNLSILEKSVQNIENSTGEKINLNEIPIDDEKTFQEVFAVGETTGVFQFESAGMRRYLRELKPTEFEDLVAMNALYRPGPMEYIPQYIKGKHDNSTVKYMHKVLEPILNKTYGIAVYQEQVLRIARDFAGFSLGEADILRKAIGKKIASILAEQRQKFIDGGVNNGFQKKLGAKIFDDIIVPFSGYGFNRSHAVCYARIAYETAYLRANYPVEFMAATMTIDRNNTDRIVLEMNECAAMEIEVLPPSLNESGSYFTVIENKVDKAQTKIETEENTETSKNLKKIRFGLTAIKGIGEEPVLIIIKERNENGKYQSLQDFAKRVPAKLMNKKTLEALSFSGALDEFGNRKAIVDSLDDLSKFAKEHEEKSSAGQIGLFGGVDESAIDFVLKDTKATKEDILKWERESLGLFVSDHPLKGLGKYFAKYGKLIGKLTEDEDGGEKRTLHGIVTQVKKIITKRGKNMAILTIEDTSGKIECAVFPMIFDKIPARVFEVDAFIRTKGKVDERDGNLNFIVDEVKLGKLKEIQHMMESFEEEKPKASVQTNKDIFEIVIPEKTTKEQINEVKKLLMEVKSVKPTAISAKVQLQGKWLNIPFKIDFSEELEEWVSGAMKS